MNSLVKEVITNTTSFERVASDSAMDLSEPGSSAAFPGAAAKDSEQQPQQLAAGGVPRPSSHRLVVHPRFPYDTGESHGCKLCPANLCKVSSAAPEVLTHICLVRVKSLCQGAVCSVKACSKLLVSRRAEAPQHLHYCATSTMRFGTALRTRGAQKR